MMDEQLKVFSVRASKGTLIGEPTTKQGLTLASLAQREKPYKKETTRDVG